MGTQWTPGLAGTTGLNYASLESVMRMLGVPRAERAQTFDDVRVMEAAALDVMRDN